jgi:2-polyprenyl-6-methoxyphenol hydroxylase-like FAD-dependent oxidoreductase
MSEAAEPDVLIVGGSLVGLSTALRLRIHGVSCLAVEPHSSTAIDPPWANIALSGLVALTPAVAVVRD